MSLIPSTCNSNDYTSTTLFKLYQNLTKQKVILQALLKEYNGLGIDENINAFNYLVGFRADSIEPSFFVLDTDFALNETKLNSLFSPTFMLQSWGIKTNVRALSNLILSFEGIVSGGTATVSNVTIAEVYTFWNYYMDFVLYQFFCTQTGLKTLASNPNIGSSYIDLKGTDGLLLQVKNLHSLLLTSENGGTGFGSGGSGTKRLCDFCSDFWASSSEDDIRKTIVSNPTLNQFCGCCTGIPLMNFGPNGPGGSESTISQPSIRCQPICSGPNIVKSYAGSSTYVNNGGDTSYQNKGSTFYSDNDVGFYQAYDCPNQTICIMDKLNIQVAGFNNQLDFNQVCPGCTDGECDCYIDSDSNVIENMSGDGSGMNNPVVFNQKCGKGAFCFNIDANGERTQVKCNTNNVANTSKHPDYGYNGSGKVNYLSSIVATNAYAYGINNIIIPIVIFAVVIFYMLLTTIDIVSHIRRIFKVKNLTY